MACATLWFKLSLVKLFLLVPVGVLAVVFVSLASNAGTTASGQDMQPDRAMPPFRSIAAGETTACGITMTGGVICWSAEHPLPWHVYGLESGIQAVAIGGHYACALTEGGGVMCWGSNREGELGDGTTIDRAYPATVVGFTSGVRAIAAGFSHTCALTDGGAVLCWGQNTTGQLGDGTRTDSPVPVHVTGLESGIQAITAGGTGKTGLGLGARPPSGHSCAVTTAGGAKCWGDNTLGQIGSYYTDISTTPIDVDTLASGVQSISAGAAHTCAVTTGGTAMCWGDNMWDQLGNGGDSRWMPQVMIGLESGVQAVAAGATSSCALLVSGGVKCAGVVPGDGSWQARYAPVQVRGLTNEIQALAAGRGYTCALNAAGAVKCWGRTAMGNFTVSSDELAPVMPAFLSQEAHVVAAGGEHTCALVGDVAASGWAAQCWGGNTWAQLGDYTYISRLLPMDVVTLGSSLQALAAGGSFTCVLTQGGGVKCWGLNTVGQLGNGMEPYTGNSPVNVTGLSSGVAAITAGSEHACALFANGKIMCWGNNWGGQLGDDSTEIRSVPVPVWVKADAQAVAAGGFYTCALLVDGGVKCWGAGKSKVPTPISLGGQATAVAVGDWHACALMGTGGIKCWGSNERGQLGDGTTVDRNEPVDVVGLPGDIVAIAARGARTCALTATGSISCWGSNDAGALGDGTSTTRLTPTPVQGLAGPAQAITLGGSHSCALVSAPSQYGLAGVTPPIVQCWGDNRAGQLGVNNGWLPNDVIDAGFVGYLPSITRN